MDKIRIEAQLRIIERNVFSAKLAHKAGQDVYVEAYTRTKREIIDFRDALEKLEQKLKSQGVDLSDRQTVSIVKMIGGATGFVAGLTTGNVFVAVPSAVVLLSEVALFYARKEQIRILKSDIEYVTSIYKTVCDLDVALETDKLEIFESRLPTVKAKMNSKA